MAIGPSPEEQEIIIHPIAKMHYAAKKTLTALFEDPIHYLFFGTLTSMIIGLLFGGRFPIELYLIVFALGLARGYREYNQHKDVYAIRGNKDESEQ